MYDMKLPQIPEENNNKNNKITKKEQENILVNEAPLTGLYTPYSSCSIIKLPLNTNIEQLYQHQLKLEQKHNNPAESLHMSLLKLRRRRWLVQRHACLLSILLAFIFGMALGILLPMFGWNQILPTFSYTPPVVQEQQESNADAIVPQNLHIATFPHLSQHRVNRTAELLQHKIIKARPPSDFPTIYELQAEQQQQQQQKQQQANNNNAFTVAFIKEKQKTRITHAQQNALAPNANDYIVPLNAKSTKPTNIVPAASANLIKSGIYWGDEVEQLLPRGFTPEDSHAWNQYLSTKAVVAHLETGCGRMQNRLVIFTDGTRACARYRQNTDQIQGELFSFYLGQLLNLNNLAPSAAAVVDLNSTQWRAALPDITQAQWKQQRPVVLTQWLPELEPAGIPLPFQPMERHLNKYDVWNMTSELLKNDTLTTTVSPKFNTNNNLSGAQFNQLIPQKSDSSSLIKRLGSDYKSLSMSTSSVEESLKQTLIELAQWSDLIVFDYLIANLDRVVNNLYNFQWNADIMAAPAHNLARQTHSQLLVFLDNESGLLHGYRLLKKYEAYHGLLLDNLCVFRQPTIDALKKLRAQGVGRQLREMFEETTTSAVRDVLPSLPDKSIKILVDRIDRVLGQVQKCSDLLIDR